MDEEQQKIEIAKIVSFVHFNLGIPEWMSPYGWLPFDPLHDLNVLFEAERYLDGYMMAKYTSILLSLTGGASGCFSHIHASAAQRAKAFLMTFDRYKD